MSINRDLIGHWTFNEEGGMVAQDSSGHSNHGEIRPSNAPDPKWGKGEFSGSIVFSGKNNNHVHVPASDSLNSIKKAITVTARISALSFPTTDEILADQYINYIAVVQRQWSTELHPDLYYLGFGPRGEGHIIHYKWHLGVNHSDDYPDDSGEIDLYELDSATPITTGRWIHLAGTYDGDSGLLCLYVNGKKIAEKVRKGEIRRDEVSLSRPLVIGCELNTANENVAAGAFHGYVDDVRIYSRALSGHEIHAIYEEVSA